MKHLLNNLSNEEKNNIRKQHTGGMSVMTENFGRLMNAKLGNAKPLINEQNVGTAHASNINNYPNCVRTLGRPTKITPNPTTWFDHAIMGNGTTKGFIFYPYMVGQDGKSLMVPNSLKVNKPGTTGEDGRVVYACKGNDILIEGKLYSSKCPVGKGTSEEIKEFQDWLDSNVKGWVASQPDGLKKDPTKGYGKCGPSTRKAWEKNKDDFKLQKTVKFVPPSVEPGEGDDVVIPDAVAVNENFRRLMNAKHGNAKPLINN